MTRTVVEIDHGTRRGQLNEDDVCVVIDHRSGEIDVTSWSKIEDVEGQTGGVCNGGIGKRKRAAGVENVDPGVASI